jgi:glutamate synthase (NADPH/NADH) small chain
MKPQLPQFPSDVFIAGDAASGASLVVRALASGLSAAEKALAFLRRADWL